MSATITRVRIAAAHDGAAEMVVTLSHANGGQSDVVLDEHGAQALMSACAANTPEDLHGVGWEAVRDALSASWNRLQPA